MYPDLLEIFGITLYGLTFERVLWGVGIALMLWGIGSTISIFIKGRTSEAIVQGVIVTVLLIIFVRSFASTFDPNYVLVFEKPVVLHTYAFCILVGIGCGVGTAMRLGPQRGFDRMWVAKLCLWFVLIGFIGARLAHVIVDYQFYLDSCRNPEVVGLSEPNCLRVFNVSEGGLTFYGGVIAGFLVFIGACIQQHRSNPRFSVLRLFDILAAALAVTHGFGRIGCLAAGCCWGAVTQSGWGFHYGPDTFAYIDLAQDPAMAQLMAQTGQTPGMHPTQIYEALGEFIIFGVICFMAYRENRARQAKMIVEAEQRAQEATESGATECEKAEDKATTGESKANDVEKVQAIKPVEIRGGRLAAIWFIGYGALRFVVEMVRADTERGFYFEKAIGPLNELLDVAPDHTTILSTSQGIGLGMIIFGIFLIICRVKKRT